MHRNALKRADRWRRKGGGKSYATTDRGNAQGPPPRHLQSGLCSQDDSMHVGFRTHQQLRRDVPQADAPLSEHPFSLMRTIALRGRSFRSHSLQFRPPNSPQNRKLWSKTHVFDHVFLHHSEIGLESFKYLKLSSCVWGTSPRPGWRFWLRSRF